MPVEITSETGQILFVTLMAMCLCDKWRLFIKQMFVAIEDKVAKTIFVGLVHMFCQIKIKMCIK